MMKMKLRLRVQVNLEKMREERESSKLLHLCFSLPTYLDTFVSDILVDPCTSTY
jgi:hypothetical protein